MYDTNTTTASQDQLHLVLLIMNLVLTFIITIITSTRMHFKCGCIDCNVKPTGAPPTPPSILHPQEPVDSERHHKSSLDTGEQRAVIEVESELEHKQYHHKVVGGGAILTV